MGRFGTVSYNIYCNFTNYGSALQTWALHQAIKKVQHTPILVDYCPDILSDKDPLNPYGNMWDQDEESKRMVELSMPAIRDNYYKFDRFYKERFLKTKKKYTSKNFNYVRSEERLDGFVCGSDTIFCPDEFGFDDGYYANYEVMKKKSIAYAASFGDPHFTEKNYLVLNDRIKNFKAMGIRENQMIPYLKRHISIPIQRVIDPTLLLTQIEYDQIAINREVNDKYILYYSRRYSPCMEDYADRLAAKLGCQVVDISLRASNASRGHIMAYDSGVEEFLSLVKNAEYVVTNSFHGMIFSVIYKKPFVVFSREQCSNKIDELLGLFGLSDRKLISGDETFETIDYEKVYRNLELAREESMDFLRLSLNSLEV